MTARRLLRLLCLLPLALAAAQGARSAAQGETAGRAAVVALDGQLLAVPITLAPAGPLVALAPLANALEGRVERDPDSGAWTLTLAEKPVVLAAGSAVVTVGDEIVSLSQPVAMG